MESKKETFNFLHLSDLHVGVTGQEFLWSNIKKQFLKDLEDLGRNIGGWDLVIFSGDLTQKGSLEEFDRLNEYLIEIWNVFKLFDKKTMLFVVPGNHDLTRLDKTSLIKSFGSWWDDSSIREEFWSNNENEFKVAVRDAFFNYENWISGLPNLGIKLASETLGIISGDCAGVLNISNMRIGLVGLNSAWLQLSAGDYERKLDIGLHQYHGVVNGDINKWLDANDINFLVTHHPDGWLHKTAKECFENEINSAGRFHAHLFGHMHNSNSVSMSVAGGPLRRTIQASSLFGLEYFGKNEKRIHGYSSFVLKKIEETNQVEMTVWPRLAQKISAGGWKLIPNFNFDLKDDLFYREIIDINICDNSLANNPKVDQIFSTLTSLNEGDILDKLKCILNKSDRHFYIREAEVSFAVSSLDVSRSLWVVADWEMGLEEFLSVLRVKLNDEALGVYRLDLSGYVNYSEFSDDCIRKIGCSFEKFCQLIDKSSPAYLILEDVPVDIINNQMDIEKEMERLSEILLNFSESLKIVFVSRCLPKSNKLKVVELHALNEADIRAYLRAGYRGAASEAKIANEAAFIFRHTNGVPPLVDKIIKDLEVVSIDELGLQQAIIGPQLISTEKAPSTLINIISGLSASENDTKVIAFELLCALCFFPYGERLEFLKRYNKLKNFYPDHAHILRDCALVDFRQASVVGAGLTSAITFLIVKRVVREYILSFLPDEKREDLYIKAISSYFGEYWLSGKFKINAQAKFSETSISTNIIENANELIRWLFAFSLDRDDQKKLALATRILYFYIDKLEDGDHFREVANLCGTLISKISNSKYKDSIARIKLMYAQSLRMVGEYDKSMDVSNGLIEEQKEKAILARSYMNLAYCYDSLDDEKAAIANAKKVVEINKGSATARGAKALILRLSSNTGVKIKGLQKLEAESRKNGEFTNSNNIRITLAKNITDLKAQAEHYKETMLSAVKHSDGYNAVRALLFYSQIIQKLDKNLSDRERHSLMSAYQFLYSQRIPYFFNLCHEILWVEFAKAGDLENLMELFKRSSLVWQLSSNEKNEIKYLGSILKVMNELGGNRNERSFVYLVYRSNKLNLMVDE